jgi:hypothetical protein
MAFTEFYVRSDGNNKNSGSTNAATPVVEVTNGDWNNAAANRFTAPGTSGPFASVSVGDFAAVMDDADTSADIIGRISAKDGSNNWIELDTTARVGTSGTAATGKTCRVGGAWGGSGNDNVAYGFTKPTSALVNTSGNFPRINFKSGTIYPITATIQPGADNMIYEGYTTTAGDGGRPRIQGPATGTSFVLLLVGASAGGAGITSIYRNFEFDRNGDTGSAHGVQTQTDGILLDGIHVHDVRGVGIYDGSRQNITFYRCKANNCNQSNTANFAGIYVAPGLGSNNNVLYCRSTANNQHGFLIGTTDAGGMLYSCIADNNTGHGYIVNSQRDATTVLLNCDAFNNTLSGAGTLTSATLLAYLINCNFVKNGAWGINIDTGTNCRGMIRNCGFGGGAYANTSGTINDPDGAMVVAGTVNYTTHPWSSPDTGDFDILDTAAKNTGYGDFIDSAQPGTAPVFKAFPDIGAAQHQDTGGGGGGGAAPLVVGAGDIGDYVEDETNVIFNFWSQDKDGVPITIASSPVVKVFKEGDATGRASGTDPEITLTLNKIDPAGSATTGCHHVKIDTSTQTYYEKNKLYRVFLTAGTVDGVSKAGHPIASFGIENSGVIQRASTLTDIQEGQILDNGIVQGVTSTTITLAASADGTTNDLYKDARVVITNPASQRQVRVCTGYTASTKVLTVDRAWNINPTAATAEYMITAHGGAGSGGAGAPSAAAIADAVWDEPRNQHVSSGTFGEIGLEIGTIVVNTNEIGIDGAGLTNIGGLSTAAMQKFINFDTGLTVAVSGSVAKISQGTAGLTAADLWGYVPRTLTVTATEVANSILELGKITFHRGDAISLSITGLGDISDYVTLWFTVKLKDQDQTDAQSALQIVKTTGTGGPGLLYINGTAPGSSANGAIVVNNPTTGAITITLKPVESLKLPIGARFAYDIQILRTNGDIGTLGQGNAEITLDYTRATS